MENEQQTELAPSDATASAPVTPEAAPVTTPDASAVQTETTKEFVSTEPRHPLQDILDKAAKKQEEAKAKAAQTETQKQEALGQKPVESFDMSKWDGNALTLPDKIKKIVVDNQVAFHNKAKEAAELKAQNDAMSGLINKYTQQMQAQQRQNQPLFSQEEFEAAQLDPKKFLDLTSRVAKNIVEAEKAQLSPIINQIDFNQKVAENERVINDFASKHKDFWQLYDTGALEPFVKEHGLEAGYNKAVELANKFQQQATQAAQARVQEKKASVSARPTNTQSIEVMYVDKPEDVLPTAMRFAAEGKHVEVRVKSR
jgi:hypothetical protein